MLNLHHELCSSGGLDKNEMPNFRTYGLVIFAHANSDNQDKVVEARRLLESLMEYVKNGEIAGSSAAPFNQVINAAARSSSSPQTFETSNGFTSTVDTTKDAYALAELTYNEIREDSYGIGISPNHHSFGAFLQCIAKYTVPDSAERAGKARMVFEDARQAGEVSRLVVQGLREAVGDSMLDIPEFQNNKLPRFWTKNVPREFRYKGK